MKLFPNFTRHHLITHTNPSWCALSCVQVISGVFLCPCIFVHDILKLYRHLDTETYGRLPWQFCNFTSEFINYRWNFAPKLRSNSSSMILGYLSVKFGNQKTPCPSTRPSATHGNQCEISHFLASVGACNLIFHIHVVVNWQLSKMDIRWLVSHDRIVESGVEISRLRAFWSYLLSLLVFNWTEAQIQVISLQWFEVNCLK